MSMVLITCIILLYPTGAFLYIKHWLRFGYKCLVKALLPVICYIGQAGATYEQVWGLAILYRCGMIVKT